MRIHFAQKLKFRSTQYKMISIIFKYISVKRLLYFIHKSVDVFHKFVNLNSEVKKKW